MANKNFIIGKGELLTSGITLKSGHSPVKFPYTYEEAVMKLGPRFRESSDSLDNLPALACPYDLAVQLFTLNPSFLAKSYYPGNLLRALNLEPTEKSVTTQLYSRKERRFSSFP